MNTGYKMTMAFIALLMIVGISASATRASRSALAHEADSANIKQQAAADSQKINEGSVVDEVIWVVGDEAILKSDVEVTRLQAEAEGIKYTGDPDCSIPEQIAVQKLFLHQAAIDSIEVSESEVMNGIDEQINSWVSMIGSRENWRSIASKVSPRCASRCMMISKPTADSEDEAGTGEGYQGVSSSGT